jgi:hypothetical protein
MIDVIFMQRQPPPLLHLYHPRPTTWTNIIELVRAEVERHQPQRELSFIPMAQWIQELTQLAQGADKQRIRAIVSIHQVTNECSLKYDDTKLLLSACNQIVDLL